MSAENPNDATAVWAWAKDGSGWYNAKWIWSDSYAAHLRSLGYVVERSKYKPKHRPEAA